MNAPTTAAQLAPRTTLIKYHQDPGHGWIEVPRTEIDRLNLAGQISSYSYAHHGVVYLEEDCDAALYIKAVEAEGAKVRLCPIHKDFDHPIRCLPRFKA